jgi:hypothetical protein
MRLEPFRLGVTDRRYNVDVDLNVTGIGSNLSS